MSNMRYNLGRELKGAATPGQVMIARKLLSTDEGLHNLLKYMDKQLASVIIERAKGVY